MSKKELLDLIGGEKCRWCGSVEQIEFDHIEREGKLFTIGNTNYKVTERNVQEVLKCQPLCVSCHRIKTALEVCPRPLNEPARKIARDEWQRQWEAKNPGYQKAIQPKYRNRRRIEAESIREADKEARRQKLIAIIAEIQHDIGEDTDYVLAELTAKFTK